jgi:hypothetical protein
MSQTVYVAHEKHGTVTYGSALAILRNRIDDGYWYEGSAKERAVAALSSLDEGRAWRFLQSRNEAEYEYVERQTVQQ